MLFPPDLCILLFPYFKPIHLSYVQWNQSRTSKKDTTYAKSNNLIT